MRERPPRRTPIMAEGPEYTVIKDFSTDEGGEIGEEVKPYKYISDNYLKYVLVRSTDPTKINAGGMSKLALEAAKAAGEPDEIGIEPIGSFYIVADGVYERKFKVNVEGSIL